jgi:hypothetical protein
MSVEKRAQNVFGALRCADLGEKRRHSKEHKKGDQKGGGLLVFWGHSLEEEDYPEH